MTSRAPDVLTSRLALDARAMALLFLLSAIWGGTQTSVKIANAGCPSSSAKPA